jgi:hypothetical protein
MLDYREDTLFILSDIFMWIKNPPNFVGTLSEFLLALVLFVRCTTITKVIKDTDAPILNNRRYES